MFKLKKQLFVFRGPPGCGKSHAARQLARELFVPHEQVFSADEFWIQDILKQEREEERLGLPVDHAFYAELADEVYRDRWNEGMLGKAHGWCFGRFINAVNTGLTPLVVDNVNAKAEDMKGYVMAGEANGYAVELREPKTPWWLDHAPMFSDKQANGTALEDFARFLAGFHEGMATKYGSKGNRHGVPLDGIRRMIRKYQQGLTTDDVMGRTDRLARD